jgi:hypothetical protein
VILQDSEGGRARGFDHGTPIHLLVEVEALRRIVHPVIAVEICAADGTQLFCAPAALAEDTGELEAGERVRFRATVSNLLTPGKYRVNCALSQRGIDAIDLRRPAAEFAVRGEHRFGYVELDWESEVERQPRAGAVKAADG